jgi:hypothetical protein
LDQAAGEITDVFSVQRASGVPKRLDLWLWQTNSQDRNHIVGHGCRDGSRLRASGVSKRRRDAPLQQVSNSQRSCAAVQRKAEYTRKPVYMYAHSLRKSQPITTRGHFQPAFYDRR